jgi:ribonuclease HI
LQDWKTKSGDIVKNLDVWQSISIHIDDIDVNWHICSANESITEIEVARNLAQSAALGKNAEEIRELFEAQYHV